MITLHLTSEQRDQIVAALRINADQIDDSTSADRDVLGDAAADEVVADLRDLANLIEEIQA